MPKPMQRQLRDEATAGDQATEALKDWATMSNDVLARCAEMDRLLPQLLSQQFVGQASLSQEVKALIAKRLRLLRRVAAAPGPVTLRAS